MAIADWNKNKALKFTIDNDLVDEDLTDFPVLLNLSSGSGKNNYDCTEVFDELTEAVNESSGVYVVLNTSDMVGTTVEDSSSYDRTITNTDVVLSTTTSKFTTQSMAFNGSTTALEIVKVGSEWDMGLDDFTVEAWIWTRSSSWTFFNIGGYGNGFIISINANKFYICIGTSFPYISSTFVDLNTWFHIAVVRKNLVFTIFYNGEPIGSINSLGSSISTTGSIIIGNDSTDLTNVKLNGYMDGFKFTRGEALYTGTFPVPTAEFVPYITKTVAYSKRIAVVYPSVQEHTVGEFDEYTTLMLKSDTYNDDAVFVDNSQYRHSLAVTSTVRHKTAQSKFGTSAINVAYTNSYLTILDSTTTCSFGTNDFTIDAWVYITDTTINHYGHLFMLDSQSNGTFKYFMTSANTVSWYYYSTTFYTGDILPNVVMSNNAWHHVAFAVYNSVFYMYIDGVLKGSTPTTENFSCTTEAYIFKPNATEYFNGYIDEFRVSKGIARWVTVSGMPATFDPPTRPYEGTISKVISYIHGEQEQLFCEVERWDEVNEEAQLWVKVPKVLSDQPTDLYLFYDSTQPDNTYYIGDTGEWAAQQVWDDNFRAVYHMSQDPSGGANCVLNSTVNSYAGTPYGMTSINLIDGPVGKALNFDGIDDYVDLGTNLVDTVRYKNFTSEVTFSTPTTVSNGRLLGYFAGTDEIRHNTNLATYDDGTAVDASLGTILEDTWYHTAFIISESLLKAYKDGSETDSLDVSARSTLSVSGNPVVLGARDSGTPDGFSPSKKISEVRISTGQRSAGWIKATDLSLKDNLMAVLPADVYQVTGYVQELGSPVVRTLYLYDRVSGELMDRTTSNGSGYYTLKTTNSGTHNLVCQDAATYPDYDDQIISKVIPMEVI